jgi:hypothetical protein
MIHIKRETGNLEWPEIPGVSLKGFERPSKTLKAYLKIFRRSQWAFKKQGFKKRL